MRSYVQRMRDAGMKQMTRWVTPEEMKVLDARLAELRADRTATAAS